MSELIAPAKLVVYVAGPYRAKNGRTVNDNIDAARKIAIALWEAGHVALCPHMNTANFEDDSDLPDETYLDGDLQLLLRCDAIVMQPNWEESEGAIKERNFALAHDIPVYQFPDLPPLNLTCERSPLQCASFLAVIMRLYRLHLSKNADYSPANILSTGEIGVAVRLNDKILRLLNLLGFRIHAQFLGFEPRQDAPKHEAIDDTYLDAACYGIIGYLVRRGLWGR